MRPRQWLKNVLVFIAPVAAGNLFHAGVLGPTLVAFGAFCLAASGTYLLNDVRDVDADRQHPTKRLRPIAAGTLAIPVAVVAAVVLLAGGLVLGFAGADWQLGIVLAAYVAVTLAYTSYLKTEPVVELICVAAGFVLRAIGGGAASHTPLSVWFVVVISFGALFIVVGKRLAELPEVSGRAAERRAVLASYTKSYLESALTLSATVAVAAYCLWAFEGQGLAARAHGREVWIRLTVVPVVLAVLQILRRLDAGDGGAPEELAFRDRLLQACGLSWILLVVIGIYG
jgi:decaprenyl-phosphate phosphoribosyltransferase